MAVPSISGGRARRLGWGAGLLAALPWVLGAAHAQEASALPAFMLERLELNPGLGPLVVGDGTLLPDGGLRVSVVGHYQRDPLTLDGGDPRLALIQHRLTGVLAVAWGVLPWLELDAQLPGVSQRGAVEPETSGVTSPARGGLGAPRLSGRLGLLSLEAGEPLNLSVELGAGLPVGSTRVLARETSGSLHARVMLGGQLGDVLAPAFEAGVLLRPTTRFDTSLVTVGEVGSELRLGAALSTLGPVLRGEVEVRAALSFPQSRTTVEVLGGGRYATGAGLELFALGGLGFGSEPGTPLFRVLAGVAFSPFTSQEPEPEASIVHESVSLAPPRPAPPSGQPRLEELRAVDAPGPATAPLATLSRERLALNGQVFFDTGSAELPSASPVLDHAAGLLLAHPEIELVTIDGHTDALGGDAQNRELGLARAEAVWRYLVRRGVPAHRLRVRSFGPQRPAEPNDSPEGREKNRRVEVLLSLPHP